MLGLISTKQGIRHLLNFLCCLCMQVLKSLPFQAVLAMAVLKMALDKSHHIFLWVLSEGPGSKHHKDKWSSTQVRPSPEIHKHFYQFMSLWGWDQHSHMVDVSQCFSTKTPVQPKLWITLLQDGKNKKQSTDKKLNQYPSLPTHPERIKTALPFWKPQRRVRQNHIYCFEMNPLSTQLE